MQLVPHAPQFCASLVVFVSQPLVALPSQLAYPVLQLGEQMLPMQLVVPWAFVHWLPHAPQLFVLVFRFVSQPFTTFPTQSPEPELQVGWHLPPLQLVDPLLFVHAVPQVPQWLVVVFRSVSQPLFGLPSQSPHPAAHVGEQLPPEQLVVPCAFVHWTPHAPQLFTLVERFVSQPLTLLPSQLA